MKKMVIFIIFILTALSCSTSSPIDRMKHDLNRYSEYTIMLQDMKKDGNFFPSYYHRYKIVYADDTGTEEDPVYQSEITDWHKVDKRTFYDYSNFLGMVVASKTRDGGISDSQHPPGYQYVGNPRYGQWRNDSRGGSFWEFYGKYAMLSTVLGMFRRPIYRGDWDNYRRYSSSGRPYYGQNREYGTNGSYTKQTNRSFFQRRRERDLARRTRFSDRVGSRVRRSNMSGFRRRSFGFGK
ncbi:MAG: hypothetical protein SVZ03_13405 [Spirochaetota bacterium]|nr:hypothetical protein [Spirochaetota bacterium]